jgi:transcriptional regulator with XRE-family HTH domain
VDKYNPSQFWSRFKTLSEKDLPVIIRTGIKQPTLSNWRVNEIYPRADDAVRIAEALGTTVEYLVTGSDKILPPLDPAALEIALISIKLSPKGKKTLLYVAKGLLPQFPKT